MMVVVVLTAPASRQGDAGPAQGEIEPRSSRDPAEIEPRSSRDCTAVMSSPLTATPRGPSFKEARGVRIRRRRGGVRRIGGGTIVTSNDAENALGCLSSASRRHLVGISSASRRHLFCISPPARASPSRSSSAAPPPPRQPAAPRHFLDTSQPLPRPVLPLGSPQRRRRKVLVHAAARPAVQRPLLPYPHRHSLFFRRPPPGRRAASA